MQDRIVEHGKELYAWLQGGRPHLRLRETPRGWPPTSTEPSAEVVRSHGALSEEAATASMSPSWSPTVATAATCIDSGEAKAP